MKTLEAKLKMKLWDLCKKITRGRYGMKCFTCGRDGLEGSNCHTGHFIPSSSGGILRYDLRNLRPQCYDCNINKGGNGAEFYRKLVNVEGQKYVDDLFKDKQKILKIDRTWLQKMIDKYESISN